MSFINARVVASNVDPSAYSKTDERRGNATYPMSRSDLLSFAVCPQRWVRGFRREESAALKNGSLIDTLLLQADKFHELYAEVPATYTDVKTSTEKTWNWNANTCKEWREQQSGKECVKSDAMVEAREAVQVVMANPVLKSIIDNSAKQVFCVAQYCDKATGLVVPVKALLDIAPALEDRFGRFLFDFKTTKTASMRARQRDCYTYNYDAQAALHGDIYCAATGEDRCNFAHIVQESVKPWHVELDLFSVEFLEIGRGKYLSALALYCQCLARNEWPGYFAQTVIDGFRILQPDSWMSVASDARPSWSEEPTPEPTERFDILT